MEKVPSGLKVSSTVANGQPREVATYDYTDERGQLLFQSVRREPGADGAKKDFRQRRPDGNGGWIWNLQGIRLVPYRLPELGGDASRPVFIVEGEKDVDNLARIGLVATTNPMGAGKWRAEFNEFFSGREVVILPDNDDLGRKHAAEVARQLKHVAKLVTVIELPDLPPKGDVSDWLEIPGNDRLKLLELVNTRMNAQGDGHGDAWEGNNPADELPVAVSWRPFPLDALPEPMRGYVDACANAIDCDPAYEALPMLATMAGAIGNARRIRLKPGWTEPAIVWSGVIGESGTAKSPALDHAKEFPRRRQALAMARNDAAVKEYDLAALKYEVELAAWKRGKGKGDPPDKLAPPTLQRCIVVDSTIEAIAAILKDNWRGVLLMPDELAGWLGGFDRYAKKGGGEAAKWIEMHGGRSVLIDRKTGNPRVIYIPRAALSLCGGIQPGILRRLIGQEHKDSGLLARLLMAWPPRRPRIWTDAVPSEELTQRLGMAYSKLWELAPIVNDDGEPEPVVVDLSPAAKDLFVAFVNEHGKEQFTMEGDLAAAWSKLEGYAARLALIHHLVRCADDPMSVDHNYVGDDSIRAGITLVRWFGNEDRRIYSALHEKQKDTDRRELVDLIQRHGGRMTPRDLQRATRRFPSADAAEAALDELTRGEIKGRWEPQGQSAQGGRPARVFCLL